jgi:CRISPR/Cas system endoribonuclease Cas6 (RAMP superfamily)
MQDCWRLDYVDRPSFDQLLKRLKEIKKELAAATTEVRTLKNFKVAQVQNSSFFSSTEESTLSTPPSKVSEFIVSITHPLLEQQEFGSF